MERDLISTGQAARLCSVTPDTILKWIKKNKLDAVKTAGGHYRVFKDELKPYMLEHISVHSTVTISESEAEPIQINYCWEFHAENGRTTENCKECIIYKSKAQKCYLMAGMGDDVGHAQNFCTKSCYECEFFNYIFITKCKENIVK